ncbi:carboxypeptidase-like regulatory domain-containing protein [Planctomicrobium sp.]|nr:carboxypeptidase-like regulatory domain-containing protein [Planctomicrobium sp.]MDA7503729.1 carboxypeptidase-like regulatory domain-containing protein [bacterium]MDB4733300.1 carboxypeptidase-like regulatory domain-containing protein [Planctomicrobium sp.]
MYNVKSLILGLVATSGMLMGCSGDKSPDRPATTPTTGVVTYNGDPVEGATVTFKPGADGKAAFGKTDGEGKFALTTFEGGDGAIPGSYTVAVTKMEVMESNAVSMDDPNYDPTIEEPEPKSLLPAKYADAANSGLTATVGTEPGDVKLELAD